MISLLIRLADARLGSVIGVGCLLASLPLYQSYGNRPILDRWSYPFAGFALVVALGWATTVVRARRATRAPLPADRLGLLSGRLWELGLLAWGVAYLVDALHRPESASRALNLNLVGSTHPAAAALDWFAMLALLVAVMIRAAPLFPGRAAGLGLSLATTLILLVLLEGVARGKAILAPAPMGFPTYSGEMWTGRYVELNRSGFRDAEHSASAGERRRLLVVGDSYAFGVGVKDPAERFGEQLGRQLASATGESWEVLNASRPDTHTLQHIDFLEGMARYRPDVIVLLYVFNDIDYLRPVTPRSLLSEGASGALQRLHPLLLLHRNSFAFQEALVRVRGRLGGAGEPAADPYADPEAVGAHLRDVERFVASGERTGARVAVVPIDIGVVAEPVLRERYSRFVGHAREAGIPLWTAEGAFEGMAYSSLYVNAFDHHPNALAYRAAAEFVGRQAAADLLRP